MSVRWITPPADLPVAGAPVPGVVVRAAFVLVGVALSLIVYGVSGLLAVAVIFTVAAAWAPQYLFGWGVVLFLAAGQLAHHDALTWQFLVVLAGVHLLHALGVLCLELPWHSWVQPAVFVAPLARFVAIQVPTQLVAVVALVLLAPGAHGHRPLTVAPFAVVGTVALAGLVLLLLRPPPAGD